MTSSRESAAAPGAGLERWRTLSDPLHAAECVEDKLPFRDLLAALSRHPSADRVYGGWSHLTLTIFTSPLVAERFLDTAIASIALEQSGWFLVGHSDGGRPWGEGKENGYLVRVGRWAYCNQEQAVQLIGALIDQALALPAATASSRAGDSVTMPVRGN